jgi:hypothetical protein
VGLYTDTDYATWDELKGRINTPTDKSQMLGQQLLNTAAYLVDHCTRRPPEGVLAFSLTAPGVTRLFDDDETDSIAIDDCQAVTTVLRGGVAISSEQYVLWPYNEQPKTRILFRYPATRMTPRRGPWYGHPYANAGAGQLSLTGTWGFCASEDRPPIIKEATLMQAERLYERCGLDPEKLLMAMRNPYRSIDPLVLDVLYPVRKKGARIA